MLAVSIRKQAPLAPLSNEALLALKEIDTELRHLSNLLGMYKRNDDPKLWERHYAPGYTGPINQPPRE